LIVLDASAAIELVLASRAGASIAARIADPDETLHAPELLPVEVAQVLRRYVEAGLVDVVRARHALDDLVGLGVTLYGHEELLDRIWELRANLTAYDAAYVALAEALGAPLVTRDRRIARAPGHRARVEVV
jgi:predicted nucleic acid-binding protein